MVFISIPQKVAMTHAFDIWVMKITNSAALQGGPKHILPLKSSRQEYLVSLVICNHILFQEIQIPNLFASSVQVS